MSSPNRDDELQIVFEDHEEDYKAICRNLYNSTFAA